MLRCSHTALAALTAFPCVCVQNYCVRGLELFASYLFQDILELYDWNLTGTTPRLGLIVKSLNVWLTFFRGIMIVCFGFKMCSEITSKVPHLAKTDFTSVF